MVEVTKLHQLVLPIGSRHARYLGSYVSNAFYPRTATFLRSRLSLNFATFRDQNTMILVTAVILSLRLITSWCSESRTIYGAWGCIQWWALWNIDSNSIQTLRKALHLNFSMFPVHGPWAGWGHNKSTVFSTLVVVIKNIDLNSAGSLT